MFGKNRVKKYLVFFVFLMISLGIVYYKTFKVASVQYIDFQDNVATMQRLKIIDKPIAKTNYRKRLMREYSIKHYGEDFSKISPQAIVVHWTAIDSLKSTFGHFNKDEYHHEKGTLNVGSQFIVDKNGDVYRIMGETDLARHSIGYNWCAIGIENVGGVKGKDDLNQKQLEANVLLIKYLHKHYPTIKYVWGHYQQDIAKKTGLYKEKIKGYGSIKIDPGNRFISDLKKESIDEGVQFLDI